MEVNMRSLIANVTSGRDCGELPGRTPRADARMAHRASPVRPGSPGSPPVSPKRHHTAAPHSMSAFAEKVQQSCAPDTLTAAEWFPTFQVRPSLRSLYTLPLPLPATSSVHVGFFGACARRLCVWPLLGGCFPAGGRTACAQSPSPSSAAG